jgi:flavodoxin I
MEKVGIFYGSSTGNTRDVSVQLREALGPDAADLLDVAETAPQDLGRYRNLVFAVSTWGAGDLQDDWETFFPGLNSVDLSGKVVGLLVLGDQKNYPDTFVDCLAVLADKVTEQGGICVGDTSTEGYSFESSRGVRNGRFPGLVIDEDNQSELTATRIREWVKTIRMHLH